METAIVIITLALGVLLAAYVWIIQPAREARQQHAEMLASLKCNDAVVTVGGLCGRVVDVDVDVVLLQVAGDTDVRVLRSHIAGRSGVEVPRSSRRERLRPRDDERERREEVFPL